MAPRANAGLLKRVGTLCLSALALCGVLCAQRLATVEQVAERRAPDYAPALDGAAVTVNGTVSSAVIQFPFYSQLAIQNDAGHGLVLEGTSQQFANLQPGDRIEARGRYRSAAVCRLFRSCRFARLRAGRLRLPSTPASQRFSPSIIWASWLRLTVA